MDSKEELSKQISASSTNQSSISLPEIQYDRKRLEEIIEEALLSGEHLKEVTAYLNTIDEELVKIKRFQFKTNPSDFYEMMKGCVFEINNTADVIYKIIQKYPKQELAANKIKKIIEDRIKPLEKELTHHLAMSQQVRDELELKTKKLYAQQSFVARSAAIQEYLRQHLLGISALLKKSGEASPRCYISYAWPSIENKDKEYWVQPFLYLLCEHLKAAGIDIVLDVRDNKPGDSIYVFTDKNRDDGYIITIGTESLRQKHLGDTTAAIKVELNIALRRNDENKKLGKGSRIYPLLISGTVQTSFPDDYSMHMKVYDARDGHEVNYIELIENLVAWLHHNKLNNDKNLALKEEYLNKWREFSKWYKSHGGLTNAASAEVIEAELTLGLHKKRLEHLRQGLNYQALEIQEKVEYSSAVDIKIISAMMESSGINPQNLWNAAGSQYQRPPVNQHFVPRQSLQARINEHFKNKDQQVLTLTAYGMGGMGKTTLASHYFQHPPHPYAIRVWFNAGSREQIYQQYLDLIKQTEGVEYPKEMPIEEQVQRVKQWLEKQKDCLLVFDNVERAEDLEGLLPEQGKHHILITSRSEIGWPKEQRLDIDKMEAEEAIDLIIKITGIDKEKNKSLLQELVSENYLGCLPLAVAQAGAYMDSNSTNIQKYMQRFKESQEKFLNEENFNIKHLPAWVTFNMNFDALQKVSPMALDTLKQASWLNHAAIPESFLSTMVGIADEIKIKETWDDIKKQLKRYSLMRFDSENHLINIHPLLQDILRSKQTGKDQIETFKFVCACMDEIFGKRSTPNLNYRIFLPHAERLNQHSEHIAKLVDAHNHKSVNIFSTKPNCLNNIYHKLGLVEKSLIYLIKQKNIYEKFYGQEDINTAVCLGNLGIVFFELGKLNEAKYYLERALKIQEAHYGEGHFEIAPVLINLGNCFMRLGELNEAKKYYVAALKIQEKHFGKGHLETAATLVNLGNLFRQFGKIVEAKDYYLHALNIQIRCFGEGDIETAAALLGLGVVFRQLGKLDEAKKCLEQALKINEAQFGEKHSAITNSLISLGNVLLDLDKLDVAEKYYGRALKIQEAHYGSGHFETIVVLGALGNFFRRSNKPYDAKNYYEQALNIQKKYYNDEHFEIAITLVNLGNIFFQLDKFDIAKQYYEQALKIQERHYGLGNINLVIILYNLGQLYLKSKQPQQAKQYVLRAKEISINEAGGQQYLLKIENLLQKINIEIKATKAPMSLQPLYKNFLEWYYKNNDTKPKSNFDENERVFKEEKPKLKASK